MQPRQPLMLHTWQVSNSDDGGKNVSVQSVPMLVGEEALAAAAPSNVGSGGEGCHG